MAAIAADRHLLFGLLALQNGLIDQGQLVAAFQAWTRDKARSLPDYGVRFFGNAFSLGADRNRGPPDIGRHGFVVSCGRARYGSRSDQ
jgi:hypothetical protein